MNLRSFDRALVLQILSEQLPKLWTLLCFGAAGR